MKFNTVIGTGFFRYNNILQVPLSCVLIGAHFFEYKIEKVKTRFFFVVVLRSL